MKGAEPIGHNEHGEQNLNHREPATHYRYGYKVASAPARLVGTDSNRDAAITLAQEAAKGAQRLLEQIGAPSLVDWWIQKRTATTQVVYEAPDGGTITKGTA